MSDSISRQEVLDEINRIGNRAFTEYAYYSNLFDFVCELPSVEPERKPGKWKITSTLEPTRGFFAECSNCKEIVFGGGKYCKECGAKMEVDG